MASGAKKKTTFAKLARESKLRERRIDKQARKDARKRASEAEQAPLSEAQQVPLSDEPPAGEAL
jgi:hypothetical protein